MRKLTRAQIEAGGAAMPETMRFHDVLYAQKLESVEHVPEDGEYPPLDALHFSHGSILEPRYDDEGNPGFVDWEIADRNGIALVGQTVRDLIGKRVFEIGYLHDAHNDIRRVVPFIQFEDQRMLVCLTPHGGGVIYHERPGDRPWDLFCQFTPKNQTTRKETQT